MKRIATYDLSLLIPLLEQEFDDGGKEDYYMPFALTPVPADVTERRN
jgi:hypothetical protein